MGPTIRRFVLWDYYWGPQQQSDDTGRRWINRTLPFIKSHKVAD